MKSLGKLLAIIGALGFSVPALARSFVAPVPNKDDTA